jgi:hypothetical protein
MSSPNNYYQENGSKSSEWAYLEKRIAELIKEVKNDPEAILPRDNEARTRFDSTFVEVLEKLHRHETLVGGKMRLNVEDVVALRTYARNNMNIVRGEENLTDEQKIWKLVYQEFDVALGRLVSPEIKANIDNIEKKSRDLIELKKYLEEKLRRDGDDSTRGKITLLLFLIAGGIFAWISYSEIGTTMYGTLIGFLLGLVYLVVIANNSWAGGVVGIYLNKIGKLLGSSALERLALKIADRAWEIKNKE